MGQAKLRGSFEQRQAEALERKEAALAARRHAWDDMSSKDKRQVLDLLAAASLVGPPLRRSSLPRDP